MINIEFDKVGTAYRNGYEVGRLRTTPQTFMNVYFLEKTSGGGAIYDDYIQNGYNADGSVNKNYANTCALRMSYALNKAGYTINKTTGTYEGAKGLNYFYTVEYMKPYLMNTYNFTQLTSGSIRNALIIQTNCGWTDASGHIDIMFRGRAGSEFHNECSTNFYLSK